MIDSLPFDYIYDVSLQAPGRVGSIVVLSSLIGVHAIVIAHERLLASVEYLRDL